MKLLTVCQFILLPTVYTVQYVGIIYSIKLGRLSWGCPVLDSLLGGGVLVPGVTELSGVSAAGKTQLCLQLSLVVQLSQRQGGLDGGN